MTLPTNRQAGICLHISSLPGAHGIGTLGAEAHRFTDRLAAMGVRVWQFLPIGPTAYGDSPYQPLSVYAGNVLLIDVEQLVRDGLVTADEAAPLTELPLGYTDYGRLIPLKERVLVQAAARFERSADATQRAAYADFLSRNDARWLHEYARFRVLKSLHDERAWPEWAPHYVQREEAALRAIEADWQPRIEQIKVLQFLFAQQWAKLHHYATERGVALFGDVPIYIAHDSVDAWVARELLHVDDDGRPEFVAGVPPDYFSADGQLWGNPLYDWDRHASSDFAWWIERIRHATSTCDLIRLDHFRGFESYWSIPAWADTARTGEWLSGPADALFDALRDALGELPIVAEDLGIITDAVNAFRERQGFPGMKVLQFMVGDPHFDPSHVPWNSVCYTGTHDNDTTVGWFHGGPNDLRSEDEIRHAQHQVLAKTGGSPQTIHTDLIRLALNTEARLAVIPMQDVLGLGSQARMNTPGTTHENWRWRLQSEQLDEAVSDSVREMVVAAGRNA